MEQLFGVSLNWVADPGNPYIEIFEGSGAASSPVEKLELRVPSRGAAGQALLILTIRSSDTSPITLLRERFGPPARVELPRAAAPFGAPTYEIHEFPWGRLTFGYAAAKGDIVNRIIFDRR